ncbi:hypothetical protein HEBU111660_07825 [Helicobacter burdigaliensis]
MVGNRVLLQSSFKGLDSDGKPIFNYIQGNGEKPIIRLVGNEVHADIATFKDINKLYIAAKNKGSLYLNATGYYYNTSALKAFSFEEETAIEGAEHNSNNFSNANYVGIGSDVDWWHFAKGWNTNSEFRNAKEFRLTSDIDFKGVIVEEGETKQNYADYWIDFNGDGKKQDNERTSMIVGDMGYIDENTDNSFTANFDGQGYTLSNINIDTTGLDNSDKPRYLGIFGYVNGGEFKNINVDYMGGGIKADSAFNAGGFAGDINGGTFSNIVLNNIGNISADDSIGGFAGRIVYGTFSNII